MSSGRPRAVRAATARPCVALLLHEGEETLAQLGARMHAGIVGGELGSAVGRRVSPPRFRAGIASSCSSVAISSRIFSKRPPDQARDVHLRDPDVLGDLALREPVEEAQVEDPAFALVEDAEAWREHGAVLETEYWCSSVPSDSSGSSSPSSSDRRPRARATCRRGRTRAPRARLLLDAGGLRELRDRRRAAELDNLILDDLRELDVELLEAARARDGPALVAEVPLDLADDVRRRVRRELDAAVDVEAVDR